MRFHPAALPLCSHHAARQIADGTHGLLRDDPAPRPVNRAKSLRARSAWCALLVYSGLAGMLPAQATKAADFFWDGGGPDNNWSDLANWLAPILPNSGDSLWFMGNTHLSNTNDYLGTIRNLYFHADAGTFTLDGDALTVLGNVTNLSGNTQTINMPLTVGATDKIWDGGAQGIDLNGAFTLGNNSLTLKNGVRIDNGGHDLSIASNGDAALTLAGGSAVSTRSGIIAGGMGTTGIVTVEGAQSSWTNLSRLYVGERGHGTLNIRNGGQVSGDSGFLGYSSGSVGTVSLDGAGSSFTIASFLNVGFNGNGVLDIRNGGKVVSSGGASLATTKAAPVPPLWTARALSGTPTTCLSAAQVRVRSTSSTVVS